MRPERWCCGVSCGAARWRSSLRNLPPMLVGIEACGSAHHWARVIGRYGHEVRLMPPTYVKPYVKRNKNDGRDAEGICEAMGRPTMRFVPVKSVEQQATLAVHTHAGAAGAATHDGGERVAGALSEFGIVAAQGIKGLRELMRQLEQPSAADPGADARGAVAAGCGNGRTLDAAERALERRIKQAAAADASGAAADARCRAWVRSARARSIAKVPDRGVFRTGATLPPGSGSPAATAAPAASTAPGPHLQTGGSHVAYAADQRAPAPICARRAGAA